MALDVEVMIVSYGSAAVLEPCFRSLAAHLPETRVAVREHASDPKECDRLRSIAATAGITARIEHDPSNPGFAAGCNALAAGSDAAWFLFLNPDARIRAWPFDSEPPVAPAIVGPHYTSDTADHWGRSYRIRDEIAKSWLRRRSEPPVGRGFVSGAALLVDAGSFRAVGGFDPGYFLFYEDIDFCLRANDAGTRTVVEPAWVVEHERGHSTGSRWGDALRWSYESACRFHGTHGSPVWAYRWYVVADASLRAGLHLLRRDGPRARAHWALARRAFSDFVRRRRSRP